MIRHLLKVLSRGYRLHHMCDIQMIFTKSTSDPKINFDVVLDYEDKKNASMSLGMKDDSDHDEVRGYDVGWDLDHDELKAFYDLLDLISNELNTEVVG